MLVCAVWGPSEEDRYDREGTVCQRIKCQLCILGFILSCKLGSCLPQRLLIPRLCEKFPLLMIYIIMYGMT